MVMLHPVLTAVKQSAKAPLAPEANPKLPAALQSTSVAHQDLEIASGQVVHGTA